MFRRMMTELDGVRRWRRMHRDEAANTSSEQRRERVIQSSHDTVETRRWIAPRPSER
jgi:hypothetical protein